MPRVASTLDHISFLFLSFFFFLVSAFSPSLSLFLSAVVYNYNNNINVIVISINTFKVRDGRIRVYKKYVYKCVVPLQKKLRSTRLRTRVIIGPFGAISFILAPVPDASRPSSHSSRFRRHVPLLFTRDRARPDYQSLSLFLSLSLSLSHTLPRFLTFRSPFALSFALMQETTRARTRTEDEFRRGNSVSVAPIVSSQLTMECLGSFLLPFPSLFSSPPPSLSLSISFCVCFPLLVCSFVNRIENNRNRNQYTRYPR